LQIIPAIDIMDGQLVRLTKGDPSTRQGYLTKNPFDAAKNWAQQGAEMIHIIDLGAALGKTPNTDQILGLVDEVDVPLQVGGGIRSLEGARRLLDGGVERIILGSMPIKAPKESLMLLEEYGSDRIVIALDHRDGYLMVKGWQESTKHRLCESLQDFKEQGYQWFLVTNIDHDGTLEGPDTETYKEISTSTNIIASGGVSSLEDINRLRETGVQAVVVGKALYENRFTLAEAKEAARC
jgi:phosphoribosylformimino-5-aminoimidazole carboxamide ribotide isomerase